MGQGANVSAAGSANRIAIGQTTSADTDNQVFLGNSSVTAWVPGFDGTVDLGRSDRQFDDLYLDNRVINAGNQVLAARITGWAAPSGTLARTTFATYAGQTISNPPAQAEVQAIDDHLVILSQRLAALITDSRTHGFINS